MIQITEGNLLQAQAEALVNAVNCVGYMGKGIALQFKQAFPANFSQYESACKAGEVQPGRMLIHYNGRLALPHYIINFPTKRHWRASSQLADIRDGLEALIDDVRRLDIRSIAVPALGCGLGGLDWQVIRPLIEHAFAALPEVQVQLFAPQAAPTAKSLPVRSVRGSPANPTPKQTDMGRYEPL